MAGCAGTDDGLDALRAYAQRDAQRPQATGTPVPPIRLIKTAAPLQCVPYARKISNVSIRGNAWTWWRTAEGRYRRDNRPAIGSVLVWKRTGRLPYGHVAVVSRVISSREILVDHANWLNRGNIHQSLPVLDVSPRNDWSEVRVWYSPGHSWGKRLYPAHGFIHPREPRKLRLREPLMQGPDVRLLQERLIRAGFKIAADGVFGPRTRDALAKYQARNKPPRNGTAADGTRAELGL